MPIPGGYLQPYKTLVRGVPTLIFESVASGYVGKNQGHPFSVNKSSISSGQTVFQPVGGPFTALSVIFYYALADTTVSSPVPFINWQTVNFVTNPVFTTTLQCGLVYTLYISSLTSTGNITIMACMG